MVASNNLKLRTEHEQNWKYSPRTKVLNGQSSADGSIPSSSKLRDAGYPTQPKRIDFGNLGRSTTLDMNRLSFPHSPSLTKKARSPEPQRHGLISVSRLSINRRDDNDEPDHVGGQYENKRYDSVDKTNKRLMRHLSQPQPTAGSSPSGLQKQ